MPSLREVSDFDTLSGNEVKAVDVFCYFRTMGNYLCRFLYRASQTMMMIMSLKPVIRVIPVAQIAQITHFDYAFTVFIPVLLHYLNTFCPPQN